MKWIMPLFLIVGGSFAFRSYKKLIPNGKNVPNPCDVGTKWPGVGHTSVSGQGALNAFGKDFKNEGNRWTVALCRKDSDLDGKTNGYELGDPNCSWKRRGKSEGNITGHPGVCEPVDSTLCRSVASNFPCK